VTLCELHKEGKLDNVTYKAIYPSGSVTPASYPVIKAHKQVKNYPARNIMSHIGSPQENLAGYLNSILKPFIENNDFICKNSTQFVSHIKTVTLDADDRMILLMLRRCSLRCPSRIALMSSDANLMLTQPSPKEQN
jgi:hypothetical protein